MHLLLEALPSWFEQTYLPISTKDASNSNFLMLQDRSLVSSADKIEKREGKLLPWVQSAGVMHDQVRAFNAWPGSWLEVVMEGKQLHLLPKKSEEVEEGGQHANEANSNGNGSGNGKKGGAKTKSTIRLKVITTYLPSDGNGDGDNGCGDEIRYIKLAVPITFTTSGLVTDSESGAVKIVEKGDTFAHALAVR